MIKFLCCSCTANTRGKEMQGFVVVLQVSKENTQRSAVGTTQEL